MRLHPVRKKKLMFKRINQIKAILQILVFFVHPSAFKMYKCALRVRPLLDAAGDKVLRKKKKDTIPACVDYTV